MVDLEQAVDRMRKQGGLFNLNLVSGASAVRQRLCRAPARWRELERM